MQRQESESLHPAIPRISCPKCGNTMRLAKIEPEPHGHGEMMTFDCQCGFTYTQSERTRGAQDVA